MLQDDANTKRPSPTPRTCCRATRIRSGGRLPPSPPVPARRWRGVDFPGQLRVRLTEGAVRQGRQVDDRVVPLKRVLGDIADIHGKRRDVDPVADEIAALVEVCVEAGHLMTRPCEDRHGNGPDVTMVPGDEEPHRWHPPAGICLPQDMRSAVLPPEVCECATRCVSLPHYRDAGRS